MRLPPRHIWPQFQKRPIAMPRAAALMLASGATITGSEPPSSIVIRFSFGAARPMMWRPTAVEPVNATRRTLSWVTSASPTSEPRPVMTLTTPGGNSASSSRSAILSVVSGVVAAGLTTIVLPAISAGASFVPSSVSGKLLGTIAATTPIGRRMTMP